MSIFNIWINNTITIYWKQEFYNCMCMPSRVKLPEESWTETVQLWNEFNGHIFLGAEFPTYPKKLTLLPVFYMERSTYCFIPGFFIKIW